MDCRYVKKILQSLKIHNNSFYKIIEKNFLFLLQNETIEKINSIYNDLSFLGLVFNKYRYALLLSIIKGVSENKIKIISICSDALTKNPDILRKKIQYCKIEYLCKILKSLSKKHGISIEYFCILPNINPLFKDKIFATSWEKNRQEIEKIGKVKCVLLTDIASNDYSNILLNLSSYVNCIDLCKKIDYYQNNLFITLGFKASEDFQKNQILTYTATGILLEKHFSHFILIDIQKKNFPFEQKFYNYGRKVLLPIIFFGQNVR